MNTNDDMILLWKDLLVGNRKHQTGAMRTSNSYRFLLSESFEIFALKVLSECAEISDIYSNRELPNQSRAFDAFLPKGISDINVPTFVEFKLNSNILMNKDSLLRLTHGAESSSIENYKILIISASPIEPSRRNLLLKKAESLSDKLIVWDIDDFRIHTGKAFEDNVSFLMNPIQTLLGAYDAVDNTKGKGRDSIIQNLREKYLEDNVALILGAGVSRPSNIPVWDDFVSEFTSIMLAEKLKEKNLNQEQLGYINSLAKLNKSDSPIIQMRLIKENLSDQFIDLVRTILYKNSPNYNTRLLKSISKLCIPQRVRKGVQGIITYNFDNLLEQRLDADNISYNVISRENDMAFSDQLSIFHVHGYVPKDADDKGYSEIVFSEDDYHKMYLNYYHWSNLAQINYFRDFTCLFIGCSLSDPNLRRLLDVASSTRDGALHYAIMKKSKITKKDIDKELKEIKDSIENKTIDEYNQMNERMTDIFYKSIGINVIWIDNYDEIPPILTSLLKKPNR